MALVKPAGLSIGVIAAACVRSMCMGKDNQLPWPHLPDDMKRFKRLTERGAVIMGRRTWESIGAKPLRGRSNIIVSTSLQRVPGAFVAKSLQHALHLAADVRQQAWIIGGPRLIREAYAVCDEVRLTLVSAPDNKPIFGDVFFPPGCQVPGSACADEWIEQPNGYRIKFYDGFK